MGLSIIRNYFLVLIISFPAAVFSISTNYDGTWTLNLQCSGLLPLGASTWGMPMDPVSSTMPFIVENGVAKLVHENGPGQSIELEIQNNKVSLNMVNPKGQLKLIGSVRGDTTLDVEGSIYGHGFRMRDCTGVAHLTGSSLK